LSATMRSYWTTMARRGEPSSFGTPFWPRFDSATARIQSLAPSRPRVETDFATEHHCGFWSAVG
jgi:para-nitrobenzyl esterase